MVKSKHNFEVVADTILDLKMDAIYNEYNEHTSHIEYRWSQCLLGSNLHTQTKQAQLAVAHWSHSLLATAPGAPIVSLPDVMKMLNHVALPSYLNCISSWNCI